MTIRKRTLHLILASSASLSFIVCAYLFSGPFSFRPMTVDAATAESLLASYAVKDTDSDGLPDWQESLYGTDPANPESVAIGVLDGAAVEQGLVKPKFAGAAAPEEAKKSERIPGSPADDTVTAIFARQFFTHYLAKYGDFTTPSEEELSAFTQQEVQLLADTTGVRVPYTNSQVSISGTGNAAIRSYLSRAESTLNSFSYAKEKEELLLMEDAIQRNDMSALAKVAGIGKVYADMGKALSTMSAPSEVAVAHVRLANALAVLGTVTIDMSTSESDPVRSLMGLMRYQDATDEVTLSLKQLHDVVAASGSLPTEGDSGFGFYSALTLAHNTEVSEL